jgi:hypothetical protein
MTIAPTIPQGSVCAAASPDSGISTTIVGVGGEVFVGPSPVSGPGSSVGGDVGGGAGVVGRGVGV